MALYSYLSTGQKKDLKGGEKRNLVEKRRSLTYVSSGGTLRERQAEGKVKSWSCHQETSERQGKQLILASRDKGGTSEGKANSGSSHEETSLSSRGLNVLYNRNRHEGLFPFLLNFWAKTIILSANERDSNPVGGRQSKILVSPLIQVPPCAALRAVCVGNRPRVAVEQMFRVHRRGMQGLKGFDRA